MSSRLVLKILFILPLIFLFFLLWQKDLAFNGDLGYQIKLGEIILKNHFVPNVNLFSYTYKNYPWIANSWASCVIFYEFFSHLGKNSLLFLKFVVFFSSFFALYSYSWRKYSKFWTFISSFPLLAIYFGRFVLRPEMFSFLMISLFVLFIEK